MKYTDRIYGEVDIVEPVVLELIAGPTMQRLKEIDQIGYFEPHFPGTAHSRFEHSVGDYLLLRRYGAPLDEQIAGLIHDVSHSAFSHCVDYVLNVGSEQKQNHQDNIFADFVRKSEIPEIIQRHNLDLERILDDTNFPLKENNIPDICSDRIDYSLRTIALFEDIHNTKYILDNLIVIDDKWVFRDSESAGKYAKLFLKLSTDYYSGFPSAMMFATVSDYLLHALTQGYITEADLYTTDKIVLEKIAAHLGHDTKLALLFDRMNNKIPCKDDPLDYERKVSCKSRVVDPLCLRDGVIRRYSDIDTTWADITKANLKPKEYFLEFER